MTSRRKKAGESGKRGGGSGSGGVKGKAARATRSAPTTTTRSARPTRSTRLTRSAKKDDGGPGTTNTSKKKKHGRDVGVINRKDMLGQIPRFVSLQQQQETTGQGDAVAGPDGLANHLNHPFLNRGSGTRRRQGQASQGGRPWPHWNSGQAMPRYPPGAPRRNNPLVGSPGPLNETPRMDTDHMYEVNTRKLQMLGLAPGLDLYGTNEGGGLTELFDEGEEKEEEGYGSDREVEQRVDENELDVKENENKLDGNGNELDGNGNGNGNELDGNGNGQTPASVQTMMQRMRGRLREQEAYIQELEDQILKLNGRIQTRDLTT